MRPPRRASQLVFLIGLAAALAACSKNESAGGAAGGVVTPGPLPTPTPPALAPSPSPSPTPTPSVDVVAKIVYVPQNSGCRRGKAPSDAGLRVDCSIEIRLDRFDSNGQPVDEKLTGNVTEWTIPEGSDLVTLPWDENPWRRWLTGVAPGHFRIVATLKLKKGGEVSGELEGDVVP